MEPLADTCSLGAQSGLQKPAVMLGMMWNTRVVLCRERDDAFRAAAAAREQSDRHAEQVQKKHSKSNHALKRLEADVSKLSSQVTALEHANRSAYSFVAPA